MWTISRMCSLDGAPVFHQEMRLHIQSGSCLTKDGALCVHDHLKQQWTQSHFLKLINSSALLTRQLAYLQEHVKDPLCCAPHF